MNERPFDKLRANERSKTRPKRKAPRFEYDRTASFAGFRYHIHASIGRWICEREGANVVAESHISRWGTSLAVRIPDAIARQWGVQEGSAIEIISQGERIVLCKKTYDLDDMLAQITPENIASPSWNTLNSSSKDETEWLAN